MGAEAWEDVPVRGRARGAWSRAMHGRKRRAVASGACACAARHAVRADGRTLAAEAAARAAYLQSERYVAAMNSKHGGRTRFQQHQNSGAAQRTGEPYGAHVAFANSYVYHGVGLQTRRAGTSREA